MCSIVKLFINFSVFRYVIMACDGLWKTFSNQEAVNFVNETTKKQKEVKNNSIYDYNYLKKKVHLKH